MQKVGKRVSCTVEEIMAMKEDEKLFGAFVRLSSEWLAATSFSMARTACQRATTSEFRSWLSYGLWDAVKRFDARGKGVGMIYDLAYWSAQNAYKAQYGNGAQKTADLAVSVTKNADGEMEEITIPSIDPAYATQEFRDYMAAMKANLTEREYLILEKRVEGKTLQEIGDILDLSRERVRQIVAKFTPKARRIYAA